MASVSGISVTTGALCFGAALSSVGAKSSRASGDDDPTVKRVGVLAKTPHMPLMTLFAALMILPIGVVAPATIVQSGAGSPCEAACACRGWVVSGDVGCVMMSHAGGVGFRAGGVPGDRRGAEYARPGRIVRDTLGGGEHVGGG